MVKFSFKMAIYTTLQCCDDCFFFAEHSTFDWKVETTLVFANFSNFILFYSLLKLAVYLSH